MALRKWCVLMLAAVTVACSSQDFSEPGASLLPSRAVEPIAKTSAQPSPQREAARQELAELAQQLLSNHYGASSKNQAWDCWRDTRVSALAYCMKLSVYEAVHEQGRSVLYVLASNVNRLDARDYQYGAADVGRVAAFAVVINPDGALGETLAAGDSFDYGTYGNCNCESASLVRLGAERHAWRFVHGAVLEGVVVTHHALLSRVDSTFRDLSEIPARAEDDQAHQNKIAVDASDPLLSAFPIIVEKRSVVQTIAAYPVIEGELINRWTVFPSEQDGVYRLPRADAD